MPTENEVKMVIALDCEPVIAKAAKRTLFIDQSYLIAGQGMSLRVRKVLCKSKHSYFMTFKQKVLDRVVEIEKKIDERDFDDLWNISRFRLRKIRYELFTGANKWEVDFFKDLKNKTYCAVAEHEMPEKQLTPKSIPSIIKKFLLFSVPIEDNRFGNKKLSNIRYTKKLLSLLQCSKSSMVSG